MRQGLFFQGNKKVKKGQTILTAGYTHQYPVVIFNHPPIVNRLAKQMHQTFCQPFTQTRLFGVKLGIFFNNNPVSGNFTQDGYNISVS